MRALGTLQYIEQSEDEVLKKIIMVAVLIFGGYKLYSSGHLPFFKKPGAFDANGKAIVRLFVGPGCEAVCGEIESLLQNRKIE